MLLEISKLVASGELPDASLKVVAGASASLCSNPVRTHSETGTTSNKPKSSRKPSIAAKRVPVVEGDFVKF